MGSKSTCFLILDDEGREVPLTTNIWPSSARQRDAIKMAFRWLADDDPTALTAGLVALYCYGPPI